MMRTTFRTLALVAVIGVCFVNFREFKQATNRFPPGEYDELVQRELQYKSIRDHLISMNYRSGKIAFVTGNFIKTKTKIGSDDKKYYQAQYNLIPLVVVPWTVDAPLILGDFTGEEEPPEIPGSALIFDSGNGLVLYKRNEK
jgi:hypothetical protein